jgi:DNA polymerase III subunit delta'
LNKDDFIIHFYNLWKTNRLPHFNILLGPKKDSEVYLMDTIEKFLIEVITREQSLSLDQAKEILSKGHADILWVNKTSEKGKAYRVQDKDFDEMFKFLDFKPLNLSKRFIFIKDAHLLSYIISNKLLKTLEEPNQNAVIIFLAPQDSPFIPTVISRARLWNIKPKDQSKDNFIDFKNFQQFLNSATSNKSDKELKEFLSKEMSEQLRKSTKSMKIEKIIETYLDFETNCQKSIDSKIDLLDIIKKYQHDKAFNGPKSTVIAKLYNKYQLS